jgi:hypothetical protein
MTPWRRGGVKGGVEGLGNDLWVIVGMVKEVRRPAGSPSGRERVGSGDAGEEATQLQKTAQSIAKCLATIAHK